jgi:hypothetical protein
MQSHLGFMCNNIYDTLCMLLISLYHKILYNNAIIMYLHNQGRLIIYIYACTIQHDKYSQFTLCMHLCIFRSCYHTSISYINLCIHSIAGLSIAIFHAITHGTSTFRHYQFHCLIRLNVQSVYLHQIS